MKSSVRLLKEIRKRDGAIVPFDETRIVNAIWKAMRASGEGGESEARRVASAVVKDLRQLVKNTSRDFLPTVEGVQDFVERQLILHNFVKTSKAYILYRQRRSELRREKGEVSKEIRDLTAQSKEYFRNQLSEFVYYSTYSKWLPEKNRRETWVETIDRYLDFMRGHLGDKLAETEYLEVRDYLLNMKALGSMRLLWSAGPAAKKSNVCAYNCAYVAPSKWQDFAEIMYVLMCGTGMGFSVEHQTVELLPIIKRQNGDKVSRFVIPDSREGWADALAHGLETWASGQDVEFDYSKIRPQGSRLKTMGGRASGPEPLRRLLEFARQKMLNRSGRRLSTIDVHDIICKIGEVVVAGGVRRSALISLSDLDDSDMQEAKNGQFYLMHPERSMANNSAVYNEKPALSDFLNEWLNLVKSGSGERGIFNRGSLRSQLPARRWKVVAPEKHSTDPWVPGTNPCVTADTWVMTADGARQVSDLVGRSFAVLINGQPHRSNGFFRTGRKEIFTLRTEHGFSLKATADHQILTVSYRSRKVRRTVWKAVKDLQTGDEIVLHNHQNGTGWNGSGTELEGWLLGNLLGDGNIEKSGKANLDYWGIDRPVMMNYAVAAVKSEVGARNDLTGHMARTGYARVGSMSLGRLAAHYSLAYEHKVVTEEIERGSSDFYRGFLRGWFDADGSVQGNQVKGVSVRLSSCSIENLLAGQRMLARLGIISRLYENRRLAANHELMISGSNLAVFAERINFTSGAKMAKLAEIISHYRRSFNREAFSSPLVSMVPGGETEVFDCQVPGVNAFDGNGLYIHNCGEIILQSKQFCNLSEVVARTEDTEDTLLEKVRVATILGTFQASLTDFPYLSREWKKNCEEEALLGVSITGQWDAKALRRPNTLRKLKEVAIETNRKYAARFGINPSTCITCVKPSGNGSQLFDSSSGMHPRHAPFYIRRVRIESHNPLFQMLKDMGVPHHPEVGQDPAAATTYVLEFPVKAPKGSVYRDDLSSLDQLEYWKIVKENYTEHNPSTTISVSEDEWLRVANWVYENWDIIGGLSFLPRTEHVYRLAPYEAISEEQYNEMVRIFPEIDFAKLVLYEQEDSTTGAKELACVSGVCEIDFPLAIDGQPVVA
ncbi:MAG: hypothetical protein HYT46_00730 [Candidatus Vogelbacteria bacterium]|nr:hypothetical protein [Candidatus Vogelbacteria bacterium]